VTTFFYSYLLVFWFCLRCTSLGVIVSSLLMEVDLHICKNATLISHKYKKKKLGFPQVLSEDETLAFASL
jgi:hypothetical protein